MERKPIIRWNLISLALVVLVALAGCTGPAQTVETAAVQTAVVETGVVNTAAVAPVASEPAVFGAATGAPAAVETTPEPSALPVDCTPTAALTPAMTEGPYWKEGSPERTSLIEAGTTGTRLILTGYVLTTNCQPVPGAWIDFWQTDGNGNYDNAGYGMRGHQFSDAQGRYRLETVVPGLYPGRTAHIHVKVQAPGGPVLTSQLFVPGEPGNESDRIFDPALLMNMQEGPEGVTATFNFVVATQ